MVILDYLGDGDFHACNWRDESFGREARARTVVPRED